MLPVVTAQLAHIRPPIFSSVRLLYFFHGNYILDGNICQRQAIQRYVHLNTTDQPLHTNKPVWHNSHEPTQNRSSVQSEKTSGEENQHRRTTSTVLNCRLIQPAEFTSEFENLVFRTFICATPMPMHLGLTQPEECIMLFIRQTFKRAQEDGLSLGIYDDTNNDDQHKDGKSKDPIGSDNIDQSHYSARVKRQQLPVCYVINLAESVDDPPSKNDIILDLTKASADNRPKYEHIMDVLSKTTEGLDLFAQYGARRLLQSFLAGVEPRYAHQGLFTRLKVATIELARANNFDLRYSKATSQFSTRANLKLGFHKARTIDYSTYKDANGRRVFAGMSKTHQACTLTIKDLRH